MARSTPNTKQAAKKPALQKKKGDEPGKKKKKPLQKKSKDDGDISAAERRADRKQAERDQRTGKRYLEQARNLNPQAKALQRAIPNMRQRRDQDWTDIEETRQGQIKLLQSSAKTLSREYDTALENNEIAAAGTLEAGESNAVRERAETLSQLIAQGAGESDTMRAMLMAARNQNANARQANQSYWDTIASVNQNITSMNEDTQTKLADAWISGEGEKEQIQRDFLEAKGDALTQLGLVRQSQADAIANAEEYEVTAPRMGRAKDSKGAKKNLKKWATKSPKGDVKISGTVGGMAKHVKGKARKMPGEKFRRRQTREAFGDWAELQDNSYEQKDVPDELKTFKARDRYKGAQSNSNLAAALTIDAGPRAEGASLRRWA